VLRDSRSISSYDVFVSVVRVLNKLPSFVLLLHAFHGHNTEILCMWRFYRGRFWVYHPCDLLPRFPLRVFSVPTLLRGWLTSVFHVRMCVHQWMRFYVRCDYFISQFLSMTSKQARYCSCFFCARQHSRSAKHVLVICPFVRLSVSFRYQNT